jgi:8-oxo-dGTP pyrophosphatase MutT (NUDIX family)
MAIRRAAVLVPIQEDDRGVRSLVLIQRPEESPSHSGQVAFPGGRHDPETDESLAATALREAEEEIGLDPRDVTLIGALREYETWSSKYLVSPFVARIPTPYSFRPCAREVESVFRAPLDDFLLPDRDTVDWEHEGLIYRAPCVRVERYVVWGLTLLIIDELIATMPEVVRKGSD